jgi:hypothetical protein
MNNALSRRALLRAATIAGSATLVPTVLPARTSAATTTVAGWGGSDLVRAANCDLLTVEAAATAPVALTSLQVGTIRYDVVGPGVLHGPGGEVATFRTAGAFGYDAANNTLTLDTAPSGGKLTVSARKFDPPAGEAFPAVLLTGSDDTAFTVYVSARGIRQPDHAAERAYGPAAFAALTKLSDYLDTQRTATGWKVTALGYLDAREDAQAIAGIATGYLLLHRMSGVADHLAKSRRALDWLVANQQPAGGFGLPWSWGITSGHSKLAEHYTNGTDHPAGTPYGVNVLNCGRALLTGYDEFGDPRYLAAAKRVLTFLFQSEFGFRWLDAEKTRGSVAYCTLTPVLPADNPLVAGHDVLPELKNSSIETYNVDAFALRFLGHLRNVTDQDVKVSRYESALIKTIEHRQQADGSLSYSWDNLSKLDYYTYAVGAGFVRYGDLHNRPDLVERGRRMYTWRDNHFHPSLIINGPEAVTPLRLDNTKTALAYLQSTLAAQRPDGSWTGGTNGRSDVDKLGSLGGIMAEAGYGTAGRTIEPILSAPAAVTQRLWR